MSIHSNIIQLGAYRRVKVQPSHCLYQVLKLPLLPNLPPLYSIGLSGRFGYCGAGHTWAVPARALQWSYNKKCHEINAPTEALVYVDDLTTFPLAQHYPVLLAHWEHQCNGLCGKGARKLSKSTKGPTGTSIGWVLSRPDNRVYLSEKGFLSLIHAFFTLIPLRIQAHQPVRTLTLMRIAQLTMRYSASMFTMAPFCSGFYRDLAGVQSSHGSRRICYRTLCDIYAWRAHLLLCFTRLGDLATPIPWPVLRRHNTELLMAAADYIGYGDAASTASKVGIYVVDQFWASFSFPATHYYDQQRRTLITIALLEMSAIVALALLAARHLSARAHTASIRAK